MLFSFQLPIRIGLTEDNHFYRHGTRTYAGPLGVGLLSSYLPLATPTFKACGVNPIALQFHRTFLPHLPPILLLVSRHSV